jgi:hypothetical protein
LLCLTVLFAITVWPHIFWGTEHCEGDEKYHYYPTIRAMAANWPQVNSYDVPAMSATGPLYVYLLSALPSPIVESLTVVKLVSSLLSLALLWIVYYYVAAACRNEWVAFTLTLPVLCCQSFQISAIWLSTDNTALLFLVPALFDPLLRQPPDALAALATTVCATLAVATRQIYAWISVPLSGFYLIRVPFGRSRVAAEQDSEKSYGYLVPAALALIGPLGILGLLIHLWGGLAPPGYHERHFGANFGAAPFILGLFGAYAPAYAPAVRPDWSVLVRSRLAAPVLAAGYLLGLFPDDFNEKANRCQGLMWRFVQLMPSLHEHSLLLLVLAPVGALSLLYFYLRAREQEDCRRVSLLYLGLLLWLLAQVSNLCSYQRYYDVFLLTCLAVLSARYGRWDRSARWGWIGPVGLSVFMLLVSHLRFLHPI